jgi:two-component system response regulator FixJ
MLRETQAEATVFVVDDDAAVCRALELLMRSVGLRAETYPSAEDFLEVFDSERPGCLLLDLRMPGMSGMDLQQYLAERGSALPVIVLTGHAEVPVAVQMMKAGAADFIEKPFQDQLLIDRVHECLAHDARQRERARVVGTIDARLSRLSPREQQVVEGVMAGKPSKEIASELGISPKTVDVHRARVMDKVGVGSLAELVRLVLQARGQS